jgi:phage/plasmid primase-like uncharacterized protein
MDADGTLWTMQSIDDDGTKRFARVSRKAGHFHTIDGMQALAEVPALVGRGQGR